MNPMLPRLLWLLLLLSFLRQANGQSNAEEILARANKQFELGAFNLALRTYEQLLKEQPNHAQALARSADCYFNLNRPQDALSWYERALQSDPSPSEVMFRYGRALMHTGDYVGAKKWFVAYSAVNGTVGQHYAQMCDFALQASRREGIFRALNEPISTPSADFCPAFYGDQVVYSSSRSDIKRRTNTKTNTDWTGSAHNQLFVTRRGPDGYFQTPAFLRDDLQNTFNDGPVSFSAGKRRVAFCRNGFIDGARQISERGMSLSLYIADVVEGNWVNAKAFPYNGSDYATGFPFLSPDGNTLYFASDRPGGMGGWDLYVSTWNGASWSSPKNLGTPINTPGNEITPFVDGDILYFASDWHPGLGGFDIFRTELVDFGTPQVTHLGTGINSSRDDYGFIFDASTGIGYLTSNRPGGRGHEDLWQVRKQVDEFIIEVFDNQQRLLPFADIDFSACSRTAGIRRTDTNGRYVFQAPTGKADCQVVIRKEGYRPTTVSLQAGGEKYIRIVLPPEDGAVGRAASAPPQAPVTYATTDDEIPVKMGQIERFTVTVTDVNGRPLPATEVNLTTCELGVQRTDESGKAAFYYPANTECSLIVRKEGYEDAFIALHQQAGRDLIIRLKPAQRVEHFGVVRRANTQEPLPDVQITARAVDNSHRTVALSDAAGRFALSLKSGLEYEIAYEKEGYAKGSMALPATPRSRDLSYALLPSAGPAPAQYSAVSPANRSTTLAQPVPSSPQPMASPKSQKPAVPAVKGEVYAIQLAANPEDFPASKLRRYSELTSLGNLYTVREGNMYKLRLGIYPTRAQADAVLNKVSPIAKDAFVTREAQFNPELLVVEESVPSSSEAKSPATYSMPSLPAQRYAVQVATSPADRPVQLKDYAALSSIGPAYIRTENQFMHVRLGPWDTPAQAEAARAEAARLGFPASVVVLEKVESAPALSAPPVAQPAGVAPSVYATPPSASPAATGPAREYYVRVCAVENADNFNPKQVEGIGGRLEKWPLPDGKTTAVMLTGFADVEAAKRATDRLRAGAFPDAYIIQNEQGKMSRYRY